MEYLFGKFVVLKRIRIKDKNIYLLGLIKGLTSERKAVRKTIQKLKPDAIALYVSEPELLGLQSVLSGKTTQVPLSRYEEAYARKLAFYAEKDPKKYGEVQVPPPSLMEALELAIDQKIPILALDMDENAFANEYIRNISTISLIRHSTRFKRLKKKKFKVKTPKEFAFAWDLELTKIKGFKNLEETREKHMAKRLLEIKDKFDCILAILEIVRIEGVLDNLKSAKKL